MAMISLLAGSAVAAPPVEGAIRIATFNIWELSHKKAEEVVPGGAAGANEQLRNAAAIIQSVRPDILLINEIDAGGETSRAFAENYLQVSQLGQKAICFPHVFTAAVNTGEPSGLDLNNNGTTTDPEDAWGFGAYPGQYGMAIFSRFPLDRGRIRTFQKLRWEAMPGHHIPDGEQGRPAWYSREVAGQLRLSSKSHWDVPVRIGATTLHLLASHPTPPVFDGAENRNGRRNFDEIRLWADYLTGGGTAEYLVDDAGQRGGLPADAAFVILGDLNSDPERGERFEGVAAIRQLLDHPRVRDPKPTRTGVTVNAEKTSDFGRLDYVLPSQELMVTGSGVFWPKSGPFREIAGEREKSSDHCLVWVDVRMEE